MSDPHLPPSTHPTSSIVERLEHEWNHLTITRTELATARGWQLPGGEVRSLDDVLARCGYRLRSDAAGSGRTARQAGENGDGGDDGRAVDAYLIRLLTLARTEPLAARVVLQRILPALAGLARRHGSGPDHQRRLLDDLVANAWSLIRAYPVDRRPRRVVSNLVRDIGFQTVVRPVRLRRSGELPTSSDRLDRMAETAIEPLTELADLLTSARQRGVVDERDVAVLGALVRRGRAELVAEDLGVTSRTVRNHRDAAVHRLRAFVVDAA